MLELKTLLIQVCVILATARAVGWLLGKVYQPKVIGEMVAGILLGPSLLGWVAPEFSAYVFPPESLAPLHWLSQAGLLLYMFMVGLELDTHKLRKLGHTAVVISHTSIIVPFALGSLLALNLYPEVADDTLPFGGFVLFTGVAMSVTAFPVLARILSERNLIGTGLGTLTIACAAVDDVTAWCLLAVIIALVKSNADQLALWQMFLGLGVYLAVMLFALRPAIGRLVAGLDGARLTYRLTAALVLVMLASSWTTEWLGIHALFGAFLAGVVVPKERGLGEALVARLRPLVVILIPLFFVYSGLRTNIGLISSRAMLLYCGLIFVVAVVGKLGGSMVAARVTGTPWREAAAIGVLMNTRGLVELVILNIGLDIGVLTRPLFSMMVVMAVGTTLMTTPLLSWIYPTADEERFFTKGMGALKEPARGSAV